MSVTATCGGCAKSFVLSEKFYGKRAKCKECGSIFSVPHPSPLTAAAPAKRSAAPAAARPAAATARSATPAGTPVMRSTPKPTAAPRKAPPPPPPPSSDLDGLDSPDDIYNLTEAAMAPVPKQVVVEKSPGPARPGQAVPRPGSYGHANAVRSQAVAQYEARDRMWLYIQLAAFGIAFLLIFLGKAVPSVAPLAMLVAILVGVVFIVAGNIGVLVVAAREGTVHLVLCLLINIYALYFVLTHLDECKGHLGRTLGGTALMIVALVMLDSKESDDYLEKLDEETRYRRPTPAWVAYA